MDKNELIAGLREGLQTKSYMNDAVMPITSMVEFIDKNVHAYGRTVSKVGGNEMAVGELVAWCDFHLNKTIPDLIRHAEAVNRPFRLIRHVDTGAVYAWRAGDRPVFYHVKNNNELHFLASCGLSGGWPEVVDAQSNLVNFLRNELLRFAVDKSQVEELQPVPPPKTYTVVAGDTLAKIAAKFGVSIADLVAWNAIANADDIRVDQVLRLEPGKG